MSTLKPFYITTTLPYVNDSPHIGHAIDFMQADVLARVHRMFGEDVFFNTGTDEHGQKIADAAKSAGLEVQEYVDKYAEEFKKVIESLDISIDRFIRTTDEGHIKAAQKLWQLAEDNGDIYKKGYKGLYCVGCEAFMKDADLQDGRCPNHLGKQLEEVEEENYFFKLSNYKEELKIYLKKDSSVIPQWRKEEALQILEDFGDFSISRPSGRLQWGIPVPGDDSQVMYVWFDALSNYISTLGYPSEDGNFKKFWQEGEVVQIAGKDQVKFQSVMWQSMLMSAGIRNTDTVFYHGFINSDGKKMSKSLGNVISPHQLVDRYGSDATRYILLRHVHPTDDSDLTWQKMGEWYTANLVNGIGNLTARVMRMAETHLNEPTQCRQGTPSDIDLEYKKAFDSFEFNKALDIVWAWIGDVDEQITSEEPFKVVKVDKEKAQEMISSYVEQLHKIAIHLQPIMPRTSEIIIQAIKENKKPDNMFERLE